MDKYRSLAERQIAKAQAEGKLQGLESEGAPLPDRPVETGEDAAVSTGIRIMAEAGALPEEFALKKQLDAARQAYTALEDTTERHALMRTISDLELRYQVTREARRSFMR